jgi:diguanylate cyclase (GGDEF)-like protein
VATLIALQREAVAVQQHIHRFLDSHARLAEEHPDYAALSPAINRHLLVDRLTGLPNHMFFELHLSALLRRSGRSGRGFALLWMDVDHLQRLNHRLGRAAGDHLLTTLAGRIESGVRSSDVLARIGGDTFGMLLDGVGDETAVTAALQKVLAPVGETLEFPAGGESIRVSPSFSVGAALFPRHAETQSGLYAAARLAAEAVRGSGGNGLRVG